MPRNKTTVVVASLKFAGDVARRADAVLSLVPEGADIDDAPDMHEVVEVPEGTGMLMVEPAREIAAFGRRFAEAAEENGGVCVVHCRNGVSRSPAAAIAVWRTLGLSPEEACEKVRARIEDPFACPERNLLRALDAELGDDGALCRAAADAFPSFPAPPNAGAPNTPA